MKRLLVVGGCPIVLQVCRAVVYDTIQDEDETIQNEKAIWQEKQNMEFSSSSNAPQVN